MGLKKNFLWIIWYCFLVLKLGNHWNPDKQQLLSSAKEKATNISDPLFRPTGDHCLILKTQILGNPFKWFQCNFCHWIPPTHSITLLGFKACIVLWWCKDCFRGLEIKFVQCKEDAYKHDVWESGHILGQKVHSTENVVGIHIYQLTDEQPSVSPLTNVFLSEWSWRKCLFTDTAPISLVLNVAGLWCVYLVGGWWVLQQE